ncbi:hypothetical protein LAZ67_9001019 [Cordylochernes scorpioides]|uniref:DDE-1 domain-containing protein n=1 Tax=Cordylochernes scorpioides TaxID=51811 RepID=A0ABY6KSS6_9ARAC|nr:hypothetical protein LAZ67_9001019 [Cordylochernes scorpioides]
MTSVIQPMDKGVIKNLNHFYRRFLVENILTGDSEALKIKLDVLQASRLCKKAWDQVTSETIKHCFKKAGFVKKEEDEENADDIIAETMPSVDGWEDVISNPTISYDDFLNVDDDVAVCGEITDADIIAEVLNHNIEKQDGDEASGDEDESSVAGEMNVPSAAEATNYIMQLRRSFESKNDVLGDIFLEKVFSGLFDIQGVLDRHRFLAIKKMDQRTCIKFCVKNEIKCADAFRMLTVAYREATLDRSNVYRWYKMFSEGREDVNDEERAGRPSTSTTDEKINEVEKMILANRRITVREVAEDLNISIGSCHSIFINDLGMRRVAAKFVPKLLNCDQKQHRMNIANEMLDSVRDDPNLLQRVITGDEAWVYGYDVETKAQSSQWKLPHEPRPKKARQVRSNVKVLLTVFFDCRGVVDHEFSPQGRTVNKEYYLQVMRNLREAIRQKRPDLWKNKNWLLQHDNAPAHTSLLVRDFLAKNNTLMMPQPPYSPELAPVTFSCSLN